MKEIVESLKRIALFTSISEEHLYEVAGKLEKHTLVEEEVLFYSGDLGDSLYIIEKGLVKVFADVLGEEMVVNQFGPGEFFGEMSLIDEEPRSASVAAVSTTHMLKLKQESFMSIIRTHPELAIELMRDLSGKLRHAQKNLENVSKWSQYIAEGNYNAVLGEMSKEAKANQGSDSDSDCDPDSDSDPNLGRAEAFFTSFYKMIENIKKREEEMQKEVQMLRIQIDEAKRKKVVEKITDSDLFQTLQQKAHHLRSQRHKRLKEGERGRVGEGERGRVGLM